MATTTIQIPAKVASIVTLGVPVAGVTCTPVIQKDAAGVSYYRDEAGVVITLSSPPAAVPAATALVAGIATLPDGSETKINSGANVNVSGLGTTASPKVINAVTNCLEVAACVAALPVGAAAIAGVTPVLSSDGQFHVLPVSSAVISTQDEGVAVSAAVVALNFVGPNVSATGAGATTTITVNTAAITSTGVAATGPVAAPANQTVRNIQKSSINEVWEFIPSIGWRVVADRYTVEVINAIPFTLIASTPTVSVSTIAPRAGTIIATGFVAATNGNYNSIGASLVVNGVVKCSNAVDIIGPTGVSTSGGSVYSAASLSAIAAFTGNVAAGDVIGMSVNSVNSNGLHNGSIIRVTYIN